MRTNSQFERQAPVSQKLRASIAIAAVRSGENRLITAKHPGVCEACDHPIEVGGSIWWSAGAPPVHEHCMPDTGVEEYRKQDRREDYAAAYAWEAALSPQERAEYHDYVLGRMQSHGTDERELAEYRDYVQGQADEACER